MIRRLALMLLFALTIVNPASTADASGETRSLSLFFGHTGESLTIAYKRDGRFIPEALARLNVFLRDWRRNQPAHMDPRLFDVIWTIYQTVGATAPIHVVSAYRSPQTNEMLRTRSAKTGVAAHSQHILGRAMDVFIPGVPLATLRAAAMKLQGGGVGYYPTSGSPFVHVDVGSVRAWPRMTRAQLVALFPDGKTAHIPSDGKPLSGYSVAVAELKKQKAALPPQPPAAKIPETTTSPTILVAATAPPPRPMSRPLALQPRTGAIVEVLEGSYDAVAYAPTGAIRRSDANPFAFVNDLPSLPHSTTQAPTPQRVDRMLRADIRLSGTEFASLTAPALTGSIAFSAGDGAPDHLLRAP